MPTDARPLLERAIEIAGERGDVEGAFRLEAQLSLIEQRPLPAARARLHRAMSTGSRPTA